MKKILKTLFYLSWIALFIINEFFLTIPFGYLITLGIFSLYFMVSFTLSLVKRNPSIKNKWHTAFRRHCLLGWIALIILFQKHIFESVFNIFILAILVVVPLISLSASYAIRKLTTVESIIETEDEFLHKDSDRKFRIHFKVPTWYKYIPFNLGNVKIHYSYGIEGEKLHEKNIIISGNKDIDLDLDFKYKGIFKVGVAKVEITDCLLLTTITKKFDFKEVKVYPKVSKVRYSNFIHKAGEDEAMLQKIKQGEKYDTREYAAGDNMKRVNWKVFARQNELYVRDSELASFVGNRIIFYDNRRVFNDERQNYVDEKMSEVLVSLASIFTHNNEKHRVYYFSSKDTLEALDFKNEGFSERFDALSFIPLVEGISSAQVAQVRKSIQKFYMGSEFIFVTSRHDDVINSIIQTFSKSNNFKLRVISVAPETHEEKYVDTKKTAIKVGIPYMEIPLHESVGSFEKEMLK